MKKLCIVSILVAVMLLIMFIPISRAQAVNDMPKDAVSITVSWGELEFTWSNGEWDSELHVWKNAGWQPDTKNGDKISIKNDGETKVKVSLVYESANPEIMGTFYNSDTEISSVEINKNSTKTVRLSLQGKPDSDWNGAVKIGTVKIIVED